MKITVLFFLTFFCYLVSFSQQIISFSAEKRVTAKGTPEENLLIPNIDYYIDGNEGVISHHFYNAAIREILEDDMKYTTIRIKGYGYESEIGKPQLPGYTDFIPICSDNATLHVYSSDYVEYDGLKIIPSQLRTMDSTSKDNNIVIDQSIYSKNEFFPQSLAYIQDVQDYRGQKYAFVRINPIQYNPVTGIIRCFQNIKYRISNISKETFTKSIRSVDDNPDISSKQEKYIIVTSDNYLSCIEDFVKWKEKLGYHVSVLSKSQWADENEVKNHIRTEFYKDTSLYDPRFLLIIGNYTAVPARKIISDDYFSEPYYLTDHYLSCMGDDYDYVSDIARGRIPLYNTSTVEEVLNFIIQKEKTPSFWGKGVHSAYFSPLKDIRVEKLNCICFSEETRNYMIKHNFQITRVYRKSSNANPLLYNSVYASGDSIPEELRIGNFGWDGSAEDIKDAFNEGCDYIMYKGHGTNQGLFNINFNWPNLLSINNNVCEPVFLCFACMCGQYAEIDDEGQVLPQDCFATNLLRFKKSCGVIAACGKSYAPYLEPLGEGIFSCLYRDSILSPKMDLPLPYSQIYETNLSPHAEIGNMMNYGFFQMLTSFGSNQHAIKEQTHYHVFGDPSFCFPCKTPEDLSVVTVSRINDSICIDTNGIDSCCVILEKKNGNDSIVAYKRIENLLGVFVFHDIIDYNRIIIKKNNCNSVFANHLKNVYLQNENIYSEREYVGENTYAGRIVTNNIPMGEVVVRNDGSLKLKHTNKTILDKGFKVEFGGKLSVNKE